MVLDVPDGSSLIGATVMAMMSLSAADAAAAGLAVVVRGDLQRCRSGVARRRYVGEPGKRGIDLGDGAAERHRRLVGAGADGEGKSGGLRQRDGAVGDGQRDVEIAAADIDIADRDQVGIAAREHQAGVLGRGRGGGTAVDGRVVDRIDGDVDDIAVAGRRAGAGGDDAADVVGDGDRDRARRRCSSQRPVKLAVASAVLMLASVPVKVMLASAVPSLPPEKVRPASVVSVSVPLVAESVTE